MTIEGHPLEPFLPTNAKILFLGSFPPPKARWNMEFFYPNWINDFWRIQGLIYFGDAHHFEASTVEVGIAHHANPNQHRFDKERVVVFCEAEGMAFFDTARKVRRLKDNADDNFLEIVEGTDVFALLKQMSECRTLVTTGGKASDELQSYFERRGLPVASPKVGECVSLSVPSGMIAGTPSTLVWWRMPSTSRAYPMRLEKKADYYRRLLG